MTSYRILGVDGGFDLVLDGRLLLRHRPDAPCLFIGSGQETIAMYRGNFDIDDRLTERIALRFASVEADRIALSAHPTGPVLLEARVFSAEGAATLVFEPRTDGYNRFWLRVVAETDEAVLGCGEQMSYLDLRGRAFPLFTSEPGVGRDKTSEVTFRADVAGRAGGDYWTTNYPQPTYLSSRLYAFHAETFAYSVFDFRQADAHEIEIWEIPSRIEFYCRDTVPALVTTLSDRFGRPPALPRWAMEGAIIGLKDGARSFARLETYLQAGVKVCGLWCEDWVGIRQTSFGKRLFWDWKANENHYPDLAQKIDGLRARGIRFLGYVNPYLCVDGTLFEIAESRGFLARDASGKTYCVDFGEFDCGIVDFTIPEACAWFEEEIIGRAMLDFGLSGWMADFGEYLPTDAVLANGIDARLMHNAWPVLWAKVNADAIEKRGLTGEALFFMRAGFTGIQKHCSLLWAGDQLVDFSRHDGIGTALCGALSSGLLGNLYHHSDIGGYTSLFGVVRTADLLKRWAELACFTPVMRSHEGNRPADNLQIDQDASVLSHFSKMTALHAALLPYFLHLNEEAQISGWPMQRPLLFHHGKDRRTWANQDCFLLGEDLLVAPIIDADTFSRGVYLPETSRWRHAWSDRDFAGGQTIEIDVPYGRPAVFIRSGTERGLELEAIFRTFRKA